ncbi:hypothetical protein K501DRAFT_310625, partial [Backusella circina FSU 941]
KQITHSTWLISVIETGYQLQFTKFPSPWRVKQMKRSIEDQQADEMAIHQYLEAGIIRVSETQNKDYLSNFFTIQEPNKRRPILDCTTLNQFL